MIYVCKVSLPFLITLSVSVIVVVGGGGGVVVVVIVVVVVVVVVGTIFSLDGLKGKETNLSSAIQ